MIIGPGWTLAYEMYFYITFGITLTLGLSRGLVVLSAYFFGSILLGIALNFHNYSLTFWSNPLLAEFLLGAGIAYLVLKGNVVPVILSFALQLVAIILFFIAYIIGYGSAPTAITWGVPSALLIAGLVFNERRDVTWSWVRRFAFLGNSSYSLYLIHIMLIDVMVLIVHDLIQLKVVGGIWLIVVVIAICVVCALVYYELVEKNLVVSLRKLFSSSHRPRPQVVSRPPTLR
jgi:exopolysaccharide production protein ExoZ